MRISDWSSDVCSSDLSLEFVDGVLAWRLVSLDCLHACEADACDQANAVVNSPASAPLVALLSLRVAVVLDESKMRRGACRAVMPSVVAASRSEEHTSELQSLMRISYAVFCLKKKTKISQ